MHMYALEPPQPQLCDFLQETVTQLISLTSAKLDFVGLRVGLAVVCLVGWGHKE